MAEKIKADENYRLHIHPNLVRNRLMEIVKNLELLVACGDMNESSRERVISELRPIKQKYKLT